MIPILLIVMRKLRGGRLRKVTRQVKKLGIEHYLVRLQNPVFISNISQMFFSPVRVLNSNHIEQLHFP